MGQFRYRPPCRISMDKIYEDSQILVVNKPPSVITEGPTIGSVESMEYRLSQTQSSSCFACHRLDRDTTGVLLFAKGKPSLKALNEQFANRRVRKTYIACIRGEWETNWSRIETHIRRNSSGGWENAQQGKKAISTIRRLAFWNNQSLIEVLPKTGRTHQIRLHCAHQNCPILGDDLYNTQETDKVPMALHARELRFVHPTTQKPLQFQAPLPDYWHDHWLKDCPLELR